MASKIEQEFDEYESKHTWPQVYQKIKNEASLIQINDRLSVGEARKPENRSKNRYRDVSPYDHSRVVLQKVPVGDSDYINASVIQVPESNRTYILSQGPLEHTAAQFWQMIWEQNTKAVIMLNRVIEKGTLKCHQYWPLGEEEEEEDMVFEESNLKVTMQEEQAYQHYIVRTFDLEHLVTNEVREVFHFHYITWPDFGVPTSPVSFLMFLEAVKKKGVLEENVGPPVIHCSAGIGRSGTFCLVDSALVLVEKCHTMEGLDIQSLLISMRSYRMGLIQTFEQLKFSYMAIIAGAKSIIALAGAQEVNDVLIGYMDNRSGEDTEEEAPPPPQRVESLKPNRHGQRPPPPPPRSYPVGDDTTGEPASKHLKLDSTTDIPQKPPRACVVVSGAAESGASDLDSENITNDSRTLSADGQRENRQQNGLDSENNNPNKENKLTNKEDESVKHSAAGGVGDRDLSRGPEEQTGNSTISEEASDTQLRQRRQEERQKRKEKTQETINKMKEKQKKSETWKRRQSYLKPIALGLSLLLGTYLMYRFCW